MPLDDLPLAAIGPRVRTSPFFDATVDAGLTSVSSYNHMWLPMGYGDPEAEYRRLMEGASMWDVSAQRHVEVTGPGADEFVRFATIVDTDLIEIGGGGYAPMTDHDGTLVNDPVVLRFEDGSWRVSAADADVRLWLHGLAHAGSWDVTIRELDTATLAVQGPRAGAVLAALGGPVLADLADHERRTTTMAGADVLVSRSGWSAQGGFELFLDEPGAAIDLWHAVAEAGRPVGIGPGAPNPTERIEHVLLSYGTDTGYDANPFEVGLGDVVDFDAGAFVGRDHLAAIARRGASRRLLGVVLDDSGGAIGSLQRPGVIVGEHGPVGELRAATTSPKFGRDIGLGLVSARVRADDEATVLLPDAPRRRLRFVDLPFTDSLAS